MSDITHPLKNSSDPFHGYGLEYTRRLVLTDADNPPILLAAIPTPDIGAHVFVLVSFLLCATGCYLSVLRSIWLGVQGQLWV